MRSLLSSFRYALEGMAYALLTQRNMRIHFFAAFLVGIASVFLNVTVFETIALFLSVALVVALELVNTAIESTIDLFTATYHQKAKIAKDVAAAAVFIAAVNALIVAYLVFYNKLFPLSLRKFSSLLAPPFQGVLLLGFFFLLVAVIAQAIQMHHHAKKGGVS